ncbi:MAG: RNA pseudouridine synthase, partial [Methylocystis sp.]|nr:RNA pseudouridine synthase [Methylocystis sp.]
LGKLFRDGRVEKTYWAIVEGAPSKDEGDIDMALGRLDGSRGWWMRPDPLGLPSRTSWRVLGPGRVAAGGDLACLELCPHTGRTHQLRVHCAASGWPILGDPVYGHAKRASTPLLHLHARAVGVPLRDNKDKITVAASAPEHMGAGLRACGWPELDARAP